MRRRSLHRGKTSTGEDGEVRATMRTLHQRISGREASSPGRGHGCRAFRSLPRRPMVYRGSPMRFQSPDHPLDSLSAKDKCDIYFSKVVDLAVLSGLLAPDSTTEIGHFAFSSHYVRGKQLGTELLVSLAEFRERYPEHALARRISQNEKYLGVVEQYHDSSDEEKVRDLILLGASYRIWPTGTSFTLTYPWDLEGRGRPVRFRDDLSRFMKRRILAILREAGKLHNPYLFGKLDSE